MKSELHFSVVFSIQAENDLLDIYEYIADENENTALKIIQKIETRVNNLLIFPEQGKIVPEFQFINIVTYREVIESPWRIIYKTDIGKVIIVAILDGRRNVEDLLLKRLLR